MYGSASASCAAIWWARQVGVLSGPGRGMTVAVQAAMTVGAAVGGEAVPSFVGFIDYGFFKSQGARALALDPEKVKVDPERVVGWVQDRGRSRYLFDAQHFPQFLRLYWYDAQWEESVNSTGRREQQPTFDAIAKTPGIQLRLGHLARRPPGEEGLIRKAVRETAIDMGIDADKTVGEFSKHYDLRTRPAQKGVDVLLALDLVRLGQRHAYDTAILIAGDRDFAEAIRLAQNEGRRVVLSCPEGAAVADEVEQLADISMPIQQPDLKMMLRSL
jgi:uncharacterized LabA/DUF88 family protein